MDRDEPTDPDRPTDHPSVSVVIATRDRPALLKRAVETILDQRCPGDIEVLAVFDQAELEPEPDLEREGTGPDGGHRRVPVMHNARRPGLAGARQPVPGHGLDGCGSVGYRRPSRSAEGSEGSGGSPRRQHRRAVSAGS